MRIYLETTIFNFPFADDSPQYRQDTLDLFAEIRKKKFTAFSSDYAVAEIKQTSDFTRRNQMSQLIPDYNVSILPESGDAVRLANLYVSDKVISPSFLTDAVHIAIASVNRLDAIASLNFRHITRAWTIERVAVINAREGYKPIGIFTPREIINENLRRISERSGYCR